MTTRKEWIADAVKNSWIWKQQFEESADSIIKWAIKLADELEEQNVAPWMENKCEVDNGQNV